MASKIRNLRVWDIMENNEVEMDRTGLFSGTNQLIKFHKKRHDNRKKLRRCDQRKHNYIHCGKHDGIISMDTFLMDYLGITGQAFYQLRNVTHDDLMRFGFENVKRVPFNIVDGYGSQFFYVVDCDGQKIAYYNPKEQIKISDDIIYNNKNSKCLEKNCYKSEYEIDNDYDELEEEINAIYSDEIGERKYGKY